MNKMLTAKARAKGYRELEARWRSQGRLVLAAKAARRAAEFEGYLTLCKHCGEWRDESACRADPYINAEPRDYCPVALRAINAAIAAS
jgi:hypothetical protein